MSCEETDRGLDPSSDDEGRSTPPSTDSAPDPTSDERAPDTLVNTDSGSDSGPDPPSDAEPKKIDKDDTGLSS